jgi:hypothetical protein
MSKALQAARLEMHTARHRYLAAIKRVEQLVYRKNESMFHRKQAT